MQGCVQNGGTKIIQTKTRLFAQNCLFIPLSDNEGRNEKKEIEKEAVMYSHHLQRILCVDEI